MYVYIPYIYNVHIEFLEETLNVTSNRHYKTCHQQTNKLSNAMMTLSAARKWMYVYGAGKWRWRHIFEFTAILVLGSDKCVWTQRDTVMSVLLTSIQLCTSTVVLGLPPFWYYKWSHWWTCAWTSGSCLKYSF